MPDTIWHAAEKYIDDVIRRMDFPPSAEERMKAIEKVDEQTRKLIMRHNHE